MAPLDAKSIKIVKSTVPILEAGGEKLIKHFYKVLFADFPQVAPFFNKTHQINGDQPRALARAVLGYAKHIDNLSAIGPLANQIVHKHVSLNVRPEHYPAVGQCILKALEEVLGKETATKEVLDAWGAAYNQLADILIAAEAGVYKSNAEKPGGWVNEREFVLDRKVKESEEISSFYWKPKDGKPIMTYTPGQYIGLMTMIDGQITRRNYSLSQMANGQEYRISVKREPGGLVSNHLHNMTAGELVQFFPPTGDFVLPEESSSSSRPLTLIAGGVGITPLLAMAEKTLADHPSRSVTFIQTARDPKVQAFKPSLEALVKKHSGRLQLHEFHSHEDKTNPKFLSREDLQKMIPDSDSDVYFVGPKPFMSCLKKHLTELKVPANQQKYEFFGPASDL
jgi:nitric oxide dioxygenase